MSSAEDNLKKKLILSILSTYAKTGATLEQINKDYAEQEGTNLAPSKGEARSFIESLEEVYKDDNGRYWSKSEKSKHINKFVAEQKDSKFSPLFVDKRNPQWAKFNEKFPPRKPVSYKNDYIDPSNIPSTSGAPAKIRNRRKTFVATTYHRDPSPEKRKRRSDSPEKDRTPPKRHKSDSKSPDRSNRRYDRSSPSDRNQSHASRDTDRPRKSISPRYSPPKRHRNDDTNTQTGPAKIRNRRMTYGAFHHLSESRDNRPLRDRSYSPPNDRATNDRPPPRQPEASTSTPNVEKSKQSNSSEAKTMNGRVKNGTKSKKFKFAVIGDGYIYYMLSDMQSGIKTNLSMCHHTLTISDAIKNLETHKHKLQDKNRKVLIAIGATDLRNGRSLMDMKCDFTALFLRCEFYGIKSLITTIICFDSPELNRKADIFNQFLMDSFENVVDMRHALRTGLAEVMMELHSNNAMKPTRNHLELGMHQKLILNIPQE